MGGSHTPSLSLIICYNDIENSGEKLTYYFLFIIKDTIKDTSE